MRNDLVETIQWRIEKLFIELNFKPTFINNEIVYQYNENYYKLTYIKGLQCFVIESAESFEDAQKNLYEDCDLYPITLEESLIRVLEDDLKKYYINHSGV